MFCVKAFSSQVNLYWYCLFCRKVSGVIDTTVIPEVTCQTEDDAEKGFVSQGTNQIVDNIVNNKFVIDAANPVKDSMHSKRFLYSVRELHFSKISVSVPKQEEDKNIFFVSRFLYLVVLS